MKTTGVLDGSDSHVRSPGVGDLPENEDMSASEEWSDLAISSFSRVHKLRDVYIQYWSKEHQQ